jgi:hypothetical protein
MMSKPLPPDRLSNLDHLVRHGGSYLIGDTHSIQGVAIASDAKMVYAALMRQREESLDQLHRRLDEVVGQVMRGEIEAINEVPGGRFYVGRKRRDVGKS